MHTIKISVVIPVYNAALYISACLDSVIKQSLKEIEIICVDDGSTDNSLRILKEYAKKDDRIIILQQKNLYAGVARNAGLKIANGEYLSFLDADDIFQADMLKIAYEKAVESGADCVIWNGQHFDNETGVAIGELLVNSYLPKEALFSTQKHANILFNLTNSATWNKLFKKDLIAENDIQFQSCKRTNDLYFVFTALAHAKKIYIVKEKLMNIRIGNPLSLQGASNEDPKHIVEALLVTRDRLSKDGLYDVYKQSFINNSLSSCLTIWHKLGSGEAYHQFYHYLREQGFAKLNLTDYGSDYFYSQEEYKIMRLMLENQELYQYFCELHQIKVQEIYQWADLKTWRVPYEKIPKGSKLALYGAGKVGQDYYQQLTLSDYAQVVIWVDANYLNIKKEREIEILSPDTLFNVKFDYIIICIENKNVACDIKKFLLEMGIDEDKIIWHDYRGMQYDKGL